jgi:hypothetical protein
MPIDPALRRKTNAWRITTISSYIGTLAGMGVALGGLFVRRNDGIAQTEPGTERQDALRDIRVGNGMLWGGSIAAGAFFVLALVANGQWVKAKRQMSGATATVHPWMGPGGGGLSLGGRF